MAIISILVDMESKEVDFSIDGVLIPTSGCTSKTYIFEDHSVARFVCRSEALNGFCICFKTAK